MFARKISCKLVRKTWLTPTVLEVALEPSSHVNFRGGQFVAVEVPSQKRSQKSEKRVFSFARGPVHSRQEGIVLCIRYQPGGVASEHFKNLEIGAKAILYGPFGDFVVDTRHLHPENESRALCLISTGTGIAPLLSIAQELAEVRKLPPQVLNLFGCQNRKELLYVDRFRAMGITSIFALTRESDLEGISLGNDQVFEGRVTDFMKALPYEWPWHATDYYICGNPDMVNSARLHLIGRGVKPSAIQTEVFLPPSKKIFDEITASALTPVRTQRKLKKVA